MTPTEAAHHYLALEAINPGAAISFAIAYENDAPEEDYDAYLDALEDIMGNRLIPVAVAPGVVARGTINSVRVGRAIAAYEADRKARPLYDDGTYRKSWCDLGPIERESWVRNPTPRWIAA